MTTTADAPASVAYDEIPYVPREWLIPGVAAYGTVTITAAAGESCKGMTWCALAARTVLGLPMPGEARDARHEPGRVVWIVGGMEDDQMSDLAWRFRAAVEAAAREFGLDPGDARTHIRYLHDLAEWENGEPFQLPNDLDRLRTEVAKLGALDACNRPPSHPDYAGPGPRVRLVVMDPLASLIGEGHTISSVAGARKVMARTNSFARRADVAVSLIHHVTKGGKVAGSPAVIDSVRLAFTVTPEPGNPDVRVIRKYKGNVSNPDDIRFTLAGGSEPHLHVVFLDGETPATSSGDSLRERIRLSTQPSPGPFRVFRRITAPDGGVKATVPVIRDVSAKSARDAAQRDAGRVLGWKPVPGHPGHEVAAYSDAVSGDTVGYVVLCS
jgi:hypothetical protein